MGETSMTNSKSVDNYRFMTAEPFVMNNRTYCLRDGVQFVIYTIALHYWWLSTLQLLGFSGNLTLVKILTEIGSYTTEHGSTNKTTLCKCSYQSTCRPQFSQSCVFLSELEMFTNACCFVHSKDTNSSQGGN